MILDQSVLFGMADVHDQHRDMRLDVDNMSYEVNIYLLTQFSTDQLLCLGYDIMCIYRSYWLWRRALEMFVLD